MMLLSMMLGMFSTSCQDMLSPNSERHSYEVAKDTLYSYWGILKSLQNIAERYVILNECRGDLVDETGYVSDSIAAIINFGETGEPEKWWKDGACAYLNIRDYYHIINSCNAYIAMCDTIRTKGTGERYMLKEYAQVQSIRAWVYMQLLYAYGENRVPFYTEPMLSTEDIDNFLADSNHPMLSIQTLADKLGPELEKMEPVEIKLSDPQYKDMYQGPISYNYYGDEDPANSHFVCHSSKCLFPVSIVLGDLYLLSGNYAGAAQHYYNYICHSGVCGPLSAGDYYSIGYFDKLSGDASEPRYIYYDEPYDEPGAVSSSTESITCIPSNKGKLEGRVLTDINRLFGFEAQMRTSNDENGGASVGLSRIHEHELAPSKGYEALCKSQTYEVYVGTPVRNSSGGIENWGNEDDWTLEVLDDVGDARCSWLYNAEGKQWTQRVGTDILYDKLVSKQNPGGIYINTYPMVYRKSTVWLRYAEALNRAGFPGYAFAILKSGICNHPDWLPDDPKETYEARKDANNKMTPTQFNTLIYDYPVKTGDSLFCYYKKDDNTYLPTGWDTDNQQTTLAMILQWYRGSELASSSEIAMTDDKLLDKIRSNIYWKPRSENSFESVPSEDCGKACYHISLEECRNAATTPYLNFGILTAESHQRYVRITESTGLRSESPYLDVVPKKSEDFKVGETFTIGVHQRGCGLILWNDPVKCGRSTYNYVNQVGKKVKEYGLLAQDADTETVQKYVYDNAHIEVVKNAVEDLIVDEMGLELAFEGTRFSDLFRVAQRRGEDYLAKRVSTRRTGEIDANLRSRLNNKANWFLPIPEK